MRHVLTASLTLVLATLPARGIARADAPRPNVVLILADDLGFSDIGCYGGEIATPNLDRLAAGGLRFTQMYNTARCWPTRALPLTGYYAQQVNRDPAGQRPAWAALLPQLLKPAGYRSYHSGKWHVDGKVLAGGFDRSYWFEDCDRYFTPKAHFLDDQQLPPAKPGDGYYATTAIAQHAIDFLGEHAAKHDEQPFFLYLAFIAPHFPLHALPEDIARYRDRYLEGWDAIREQRWRRLREMGIVDCGLSPLDPEVHAALLQAEVCSRSSAPARSSTPSPGSDLTPEQQRFQATKMAIHAAMVDRMDREIGRVLEQIRKMGAWDNTLIVFLSDNGADATRHGPRRRARPRGRRRARPSRSCASGRAGPAPPTPRSAATRSGCTRAASPRRSSCTGRPASAYGGRCATRPPTSSTSSRRSWNWRA